MGRPVRPGSEGPGAIARSKMADVVPRIAAIRAEPAEVSIVVGQKISFDSMHIYAFDADGRRFGWLPFFDRAITPGAAKIDGLEGVYGDHPGESILTITVSQWRQYGGAGSAPTTQLRIRVTDR